MKLSKFCNKISLILQALWCAVLYFLIEALCRHSVVEAWDYMTGKPLVFAYKVQSSSKDQGGWKETEYSVPSA